MRSSQPVAGSVLQAEEVGSAKPEGWDGVGELVYFSPQKEDWSGWGQGRKGEGHVGSRQQFGCSVMGDGSYQKILGKGVT